MADLVSIQINCVVLLTCCQSRGQAPRGLSISSISIIRKWFSTFNQLEKICLCLCIKTSAWKCSKHHSTCRQWKWSCGVRLLKAGFCNFFIDNYTTATKLIPSFHSGSTAHSNDLNISYHEKLPKINENPPYYRLCISSKIWPFWNVLKTLNNSYQQAHHLELNRMVQTILL